MSHNNSNDIRILYHRNMIIPIDVDNSIALAATISARLPILVIQDTGNGYERSTKGS